MKYSIIDQVLDWNYLFGFFLYIVFRWSQSLGTNLGFQESVQNRHLAQILESFMCNYAISFNV